MSKKKSKVIILETGRLLRDSADGDIFFLLETPIGWIAHNLVTSGGWGHPSATPRGAASGLEILPYKVSIINDRTNVTHPKYTDPVYAE